MINMIEEFRGEYNGMHIAVVLREGGYRFGYVGIKKQTKI